MIKTAPTPGRLVAMILFTLASFGGLLFLWTAFGGSIPLAAHGYEFRVAFPEATQLSRQADVRISGVTVGTVVGVEPGSGNRTEATIRMRARYAPVPRDARAMLRVKTLLGETYVELTPGTRAAGMLPEGGQLPDSAVAPTVELDEILKTFDAPTRRAFQTWMQSQAAGLRGRGAAVNAGLYELPRFVSSFDDLTTTLDAQQSAVRRAVSSTATVFDAISAREGQLRGLVTAADRLFATTAARNRDVAALFRAFPAFERESTRTLPQLTRFARRAEPVVTRLQPAARELTPTFAALREISPEFEALFRRLGPVVTASRRGLPAFESILAQIPPLLDDFVPFLRNANPMVRYIGAHKRDVTAFFANVSAATLGRYNELPGTRGLPLDEKPVHYLRTAQVLSPESLAFEPRPLGMGRQNAYAAPNSMDRLATGLASLQTTNCDDADVAPPTSSIPAGLTDFIQRFAFRTGGSDVARPACTAQGPQPGFSTLFPQLRAEP